MQTCLIFLRFWQQTFLLILFRMISLAMRIHVCARTKGFRAKCARIQVRLARVQRHVFLQ